MSRKTRTILKGYFEVGDIPTEGQYVDLIDSQLNLNDPSTQILSGALSVSQSLTITGSTVITGTVSSSDAITTKRLTVDDAEGFRFKGDNVRLIADTAGDNLSVVGGGLNAEGHITASGHIKIGESLNLSASSAGHITASGNISASGNIINTGYITTTGAITASGTISSSGKIFADGIQITHVSASNISASTEIWTNGNITASGDISSSGTVWTNTIALNNSISADYINYYGGGFHYKGSGKFDGNITASGDISSSLLSIISMGTGSFNRIETIGTSDNFTLKGNTINLDSAGTINVDSDTGVINFTDNGQAKVIFNTTVGHITTSGNISASGDIISSKITTDNTQTSSFGQVSASGLSLGGTMITSTAAEINKLDGVNATTAEINYLDGVPSNIKEAYDGATFTTSTGVLKLLKLKNSGDTSLDLGIGTADTPTFAGITLTGNSRPLWIEAENSCDDVLAGGTASLSGKYRGCITVTLEEDLNSLNKEIEAFEWGDLEDINAMIMVTSRYPGAHVWATTSGSQGSSGKVYIRKSETHSAVRSSVDINYLVIKST